MFSWDKAAFATPPPMTTSPYPKSGFRNTNAPALSVLEGPAEPGGGDRAPEGEAAPLQAGLLEFCAALHRPISSLPCRARGCVSPGLVCDLECVTTLLSDSVSSLLSPAFLPVESGYGSQSSPCRVMVRPGPRGDSLGSLLS